MPVKRTLLLSFILSIMITALTLIIAKSSLNYSVYSSEGNCAVCGGIQPIKTVKRGLPLLVVSNEYYGQPGSKKYQPASPGHRDIETFLAESSVSYPNLIIDFVICWAVALGLLLSISKLGRR